MSVTGWKFASANNGAQDWSAITNIYAADSSYCKSDLPKVNEGSTRQLVLTGFGFTSSDIPTGDTINGIEIETYRNDSRADTQFRDNSVYLQLSGNVGSNLASGVAYATTQLMTYGGATDMCGTTLTQSDILSTSFGIGVTVFNMGPSGNDGALFDYFKIRVYYTEGGGGTLPLNRGLFTFHG